MQGQKALSLFSKIIYFLSLFLTSGVSAFYYTVPKIIWISAIAKIELVTVGADAAAYCTECLVSGPDNRVPLQI